MDSILRLARLSACRPLAHTTLADFEIIPKWNYYVLEVRQLSESPIGVVYSDGLVEAYDTKGDKFGFPRLRELVAEYGEERSLGDSSPEVVIESLIADCKVRRRKPPNTDPLKTFSLATRPGATSSCATPSAERCWDVSLGLAA